MFSSLLSNFFETNMNLLSSFLGDNEPVGNNITSDEMNDDCSWADDCSLVDDIEMNRVSNNHRVVPYNELTEVITDGSSEVTSDEISGFTDDDFNFSNL